MKKYLFLGLFLLLILSPLTALAIGPGDYASVNWKGKWYDAQVLDVSGTRLLVHYTGYGSEWDEWVPMSRVRIQVSWKGKWYGARALKSSHGQVLIHYNGYDSSWDEWVTLNRIRSVRGGRHSQRRRVPSHVRQSAAGVPSDPAEFLRAIDRNRGR